jgi:phosphopantothenate---cysteine ligase (CTP)
VNLLITAGATREPIDDVRFLSNVSTGATGAGLAAVFADRGHRITLLRGQGAVAAAPGQEEEIFSSAADLLAKLRRRLESGAYDGVIMTAAVADYRPAEVRSGKTPSTAPHLTLSLMRNPKILPQLKSFSTRPVQVIGFKLTSGADESAQRTAVSAQFTAGGVDAVVHNDLAEIRSVPHEQHPFHLFYPGNADPKNFAGTRALATELLEQFQSRV